MVLREQEIVDLRDIRSGLKDMAKENLSHIRHQDLQCACGISAYITYLYFKKKGHEVKFMYQEDKDNNAHCWIEINKHIIDLTATQFGVTDEIFVIKKKDALKLPVKISNVYKEGSPHTGMDKIKPLFETWYDQQNPFYLLKISNEMKRIVKKFNIKKDV
jgi:hypothetical protein